MKVDNKFLFYTVATLEVYLVVSCKMVCHYDTASANRVGPAKFTTKDLEFALQFCTHVIYGYVSITPQTFVITTLTAQREQELANMQYFKKKYHNVKFLLSISGDRNVKTTKQFINLLEAGHRTQQSFVNSAVQILHKYKFDGLSLDFPFPTEKPTEIISKWEKFRQDFRKLLHRNPEKGFSIDHKAKFTDLVQQLSAVLKPEQLMLTLTTLPNTNTKLFFDIPAIADYLDFVILSVFDFNTPDRNPFEADYIAPIRPLPPMGHRLTKANVKFHAKLWHHLQVPRNKIILGVATWGRTWIMSKNSTNTGLPPVLYTKGPAPAGPQTQIPGFLSWPEICKMLKSSSNAAKKWKKIDALERVVDPVEKKGNYAFRPADENGNHGIWISYEEPSTAVAKAKYVRNHNFGGVALFDLSLDDFGGQCTGDKFPILRSIKSNL